MDVITAMETSSNIPLEQLRIDGGISQNKFLMQYLSDLLQKEITNIGMQDVSAFGAACLAGLQKGVYRDIEQLPNNVLNEIKYIPSNDETVSVIKKNYQGWLKEITKL
jgi:glycerol kinase